MNFKEWLGCIVLGFVALVGFLFLFNAGCCKYPPTSKAYPPSVLYIWSICDSKLSPNATTLQKENEGVSGFLNGQRVDFIGRVRDVYDLWGGVGGWLRVTLENPTNGNDNVMVTVSVGQNAWMAAHDLQKKDIIFVKGTYKILCRPSVTGSYFVDVVSDDITKWD